MEDLMFSSHLNAGYWALRMALGLGPLLAGIDKFTNILVNWEQYLNPRILEMTQLSPTTFMQGVGVVEIIVGAAVLSGASRVFGYVVMLWLLAIAANLVSTGRYYDIAVRDVLLACGAYALARLTVAREVVLSRIDTEIERDEYRRAA